MDSQEQKPNYGGHFHSMATYTIVVIAAAYILFLLGKTPVRISWFNFFVLILATFRLTQLFVYDLVTDYIRDFFKKRSRTISEVLYCPWCTGIWMALIVGFFFFLTPLAWFPIFWWRSQEREHSFSL
jgi:hypothetical protein